MSSLHAYRCPDCRYRLEVWSDRRFYVIGPDGKRHHFFHPGSFEVEIYSLWGAQCPEQRAEIEATMIGEEREYICRRCRRRCFRDAKQDALRCRRCGAENLVELLALAELPCPKCGQGPMEERGPLAIS